jgi:hypothetical protein
MGRAGGAGKFAKQPRHARRNDSNGLGPTTAKRTAVASSRQPMRNGRKMADESSGEGWIAFAGIVLGIAGIMRFFDAIWARWAAQPTNDGGQRVASSNQ